MKKILITGANGLIATKLSSKLIEKGYQVVFLSRDVDKNSIIPTYKWNYKTKYIDPNSLDSVDCIIHLAGASIASKRWTNKQKILILDSRVETANLLFDVINKNNIKLKAFISASAVGYYDDNPSEKEFSENDAAGSGFLSKICQKWEKAAEKFEEKGIRTVKLRTAVVFANKNSALQQMLVPFKFKIAAVLGNGKQIVSWIHIDDLSDMYIEAIENETISGTYNAVSPQQSSYEEIIKYYNNKRKKKLPLIRIPKFIIKIVFGEQSQVLLKGNRISSKKIQNANFEFKHKTLS